MRDHKLKNEGKVDQATSAIMGMIGEAANTLSDGGISPRREFGGARRPEMARQSSTPRSEPAAP